RKRFPVIAAIVRAIHVAGLLVLKAPSGNINVFGVLRIDGDVIQNVVIATQVSQAGPIVSGVIRKKETAGAGAQVDTVGILGVEIQTPDIASVGSQGSPLAGPKSSRRNQRNSYCNQCLARNRPNRT